MYLANNLFTTLGKVIVSETSKSCYFNFYSIVVHSIMLLVFYLFYKKKPISNNGHSEIKSEQIIKPGITVINTTNQKIVNLEIKFKDTTIDIADLPGNYGKVYKDTVADFSGEFELYALIVYEDGQSYEFRTDFSRGSHRALQMSIKDQGEIAFY